MGDEEATVQVVLVREGSAARDRRYSSARQDSYRRATRGAEVILLFHVVTEAKLEGTEVRVDLGSQQTSQDIVLGGLVEGLDFAVAFGVALAPVDEVDVEVGADRVGIAGDEAGAAIEVEDIHQAEVTDDQE